MRMPLLLVLPAPPLPLDQGYRHAAFNDLVQFARLRELHVLILTEYVYDFHPSQAELSRQVSLSLPGVKSVNFVPVLPDWKCPFRKRLRYYLSAFLRKGRVFEEINTERLAENMLELCNKYRCKEVHFGITHSIFVDVFFELRKMRRDILLSFTAHDIEAEAEKLSRVKRSVARGLYLEALYNWVEYRIYLWKETRACRLSRFVVCMAHADYGWLERKGVKAYFIPPFLQSVKPNHEVKPLPQQPVLAVLGHLAFSAAGGGVELFMEEVVPEVKKKVPNAVIKIIGKDANPKVLSLCEQWGIQLQEYVEDLEELWREITVLASPLLVAKGIRIRVLEAVQRGIPVVCTREAATGFEHPEGFLLVASNFEMFAEYCVELLRDPEAYRRQQERLGSYYERHLREDIIRQKWGALFNPKEIVQHANVKLMQTESLLA
ncbi:MAG: glycosyltransferase [Bacteroidota bacterium]|nr:glycosyltransferase [Bacteroidota bacterium]